ncbi:MAG TPA: aminodeoxychorismate lyase [Steroidobacteraceae bacterium]|nr:aminodeoxychorismate lyase [Steroidobacteraceae bacterium]
MNGLRELLVDHQSSTASWPLDRGMQYGDGLFETMVVRHGRVRFEALHAARLAEGCRRLGFNAELPRIWEEARRLAAAHGEALLRLQLSRGVAVARGYGPTGGERATSILAVFAPPDAAEPPTPLRVRSLRNRLGENPQLAGLKHCNRLEQVLARQAMAGGDAFEGLLASSSGLLISGTMSNVFLELDGEIVTPALDRCGVAGVLRAAVLREAARLGMVLRVAELPFEVLERASALALSNARLGLVDADELDGRPLARSARLAELAGRVAGLED